MRITVLLTNNAKGFEPLHHEHDHVGILLYYDQKLPDTAPEGRARTVDEVFNQYGFDGVKNHLVDLGEWCEWLHRVKAVHPYHTRHLYAIASFDTLVGRSRSNLLGE